MSAGYSDTRIANQYALRQPPTRQSSVATAISHTRAVSTSAKTRRCSTTANTTSSFSFGNHINPN